MTQEARDTSVNELFQIVERLVDDERSRGQGLETKTSSLAGFTGAILALTATLGRDLLKLDLEREINDRKAKLSRLAGFALAIGLLAVAGQAIAALASGA